MSKRQNLLAVWQQIPVANRTVVASTVSDKTGYTLTAGSYSIRASSMQRGQVDNTGAGTNTATISSVTTTRAVEGLCGGSSNNDIVSRSLVRLTLTNATTVTVVKGTSTDNTETNYVVSEFF